MGFVLAIGYVLALGAAFVRMRRVMRDPLVQFNGTLILFTALGARLIEWVVIASGRLIGEGDLLAGLNLGRLWLVALVSPLMIVAYLEYAGRLRIKGAQSRTVAAVAWGLAWLIVVVQAWDSLPVLQLDRLVPVEADGLLYYEPESRVIYAGSLAANTVGLLLSGLILLRTGWPFALVGTGLVWAEAFLAPQPLIIRGGLELLWLWAFVLTEWRAQREGLRINRSELDTRLDRL